MSYKNLVKNTKKGGKAMRRCILLLVCFFLIIPVAFGETPQITVINHSKPLDFDVNLLFSRVTEILELTPYKFTLTIEVFENKEALSKKLEEIKVYNYPERAVYIQMKNTIYLSREDVTEGILGHELTHALLANYFVQLVPTKIQEILAGYVEYTLIKN